MSWPVAFKRQKLIPLNPRLVGMEESKYRRRVTARRRSHHIGASWSRTNQRWLGSVGASHSAATSGSVLALLPRSGAVGDVHAGPHSILVTHDFRTMPRHSRWR
jgi:hypothetical protein